MWVVISWSKTLGYWLTSSVVCLYAFDFSVHTVTFWIAWVGIRTNVTVSENQLPMALCDLFWQTSVVYLCMLLFIWTQSSCLNCLSRDLNPVHCHWKPISHICCLPNCSCMPWYMWFLCTHCHSLKCLSGDSNQSSLSLKIALQTDFCFFVLPSNRVGLFGSIFEYGCDKKISRHSRVAAKVSIGVPSGVTLRLK